MALSSNFHCLLIDQHPVTKARAASGLWFPNPRQLDNVTGQLRQMFSRQISQCDRHCAAWVGLSMPRLRLNFLQEGMRPTIATDPPHLVSDSCRCYGHVRIGIWLPSLSSLPQSELSRLSPS
jgi:hypothetical protein